MKSSAGMTKVLRMVVLTMGVDDASADAAVRW